MPLKIIDAGKQAS